MSVDWQWMDGACGVVELHQGLEAVKLFFVEGGPFMIPLLVSLVVGLTAMVYQALALRPARILPPELERQVLHFEACIERGEAEAVLRKCQQGESPLARLAAEALRHEGKSQAQMTEGVQTVARQEVLRLQSGMTALEIVSTVAPMLGLIGTASGLALMFRGKLDQSDTQQIALGIAEALNTTIFGLCVTVPCVIAQSVFARRLDRLSARLELALSRWVEVCHQVNQPKS